MRALRLRALPVVAAAGFVLAVSWTGGSDAATPGAAWSVAPSTLPADAMRGGDDGITGVACWSASSCALAGTYSTGGASGPSVAGVLRTTGATARTTVAPLPADAAAGAAAQLQLGHVACSAPAACVAVGSYQATDGNAHALIETLDRGSWTASAPRLPETTHAVTLDQVSCSATVCVATGGYAGTSPEFTPLLLTRSGGTWRSTAVTAPAQPVVLSGVSCPVTGRCAAYGSTAGRAAVFTPSGGTWHSAYAPLPDGAKANSLDLTSISCSIAGRCVVLGTYARSVGRGVVAETLTGTALTAVIVPLPDTLSGRELRTASVSCPAADGCVGVAAVAGFHTRTSGGAVLLQDKGSTWSAQLAPLVAAAPTGATSYLQDVACSSATSCTAVGGYDRDRFAGHVLQRPFVETLSGGRWVAQGLGRPATLGGAVDDGLFQVACRGGHCLAAGTFTQYASDGSARELGGFTADRP